MSHLFEPFNFAHHQNWLPPSANVLAQATRCYQNRSRTFMTTCRGSKTLKVEAKDRVPKVLPFAPMPGFKPLVVFTAVLVLPSAPS